MNTFLLKIASPEGDVFSGNVACISLRGAEGDLAVMANHIPFVCPVMPCKCKVYLENGEEKIGNTEGGMLTVSKEKTVLLAGDFEWL